MPPNPSPDTGAMSQPAYKHIEVRKLAPALGAQVGGVDLARRLEAETRDELYDRAQQLDIPERSRMTKEELAAAINDA